MYKHLLVPIDGTPLATRTVEQAVDFARDAGARISFLHVLADFGATGEGSLLHTMAPAAFAEAAAGSGRGWLARAAAAAAAAQVACETLVVVSDRPFEAIVEAAERQACDLIFMASHGRRGWRSRLGGSVTARVIERATRPVLVASVESNAAPSDEQRALNAIREEHRSLAAVIHALQQALRDSAGRTPVDAALLRAALFYIEAYPQRLHHPKEEQTLFRWLRLRAPESVAVIEGLEAEHRSGTQDFAALRTALEAVDAGAADGRTRFEHALQVFAESQWRHMTTEEKLLLPLASLHLLPADWADVASAFAGHADPRFDIEAEQSFARVFTRLMNLAAAAAAP
jgi:nucleotide-binding universal stress UspA family protein/hemerythrin-like domain-containing protein